MGLYNCVNTEKVLQLHMLKTCSVYKSLRPNTLKPLHFEMAREEVVHSFTSQENKVSV